MKVYATSLAGAMLVEPERLVDDRGFFARTFCRDTFIEHGMRGDFVQASISFNLARGTLRGMHFQSGPDAEAKLVRCTRGAVHDVIVDLRVGSPTYRRWFAAELSGTNRRALYVPESFAHGFLTLEPESEVLYEMSHRYVASAASGVRWNDPAFAIEWPFAPETMSQRDRSYPDFAA